MIEGDAVTWVRWDDSVHSWPSRRAWAEAWWRASRVTRAAFAGGTDPGDHPDDAAVEMLMSLALKRDPQAVPLIVELCELAQSDDELGYLGAGDIEDLLCLGQGGEAAIDEAETWARRSPAFREALSNMWVDDDVNEALRQRLLALGAIDHRTRQ